jgi:hypothetical protein
MNFIKTSIASITLTSITLIGTVGLKAQEQPTEVTNEVTEKILEIKQNGTEVINSVKISTEITQAVMTSAEDKGEINGKRIYPPKTVMKTVQIDNDADSKYDETIKFSYITNDRTDFTLITDRDDILIAIEDGENLTVLENQKIFKANQQNKTSYIYTDDNGKRVEFRTEEGLNTSK